MGPYHEIEGVFTYVAILERPGPNVSSRKYLGWQAEERILWVIPADSSLRNPHITGSGRSWPLYVDSIQSIRSVSGVRQGLEIRWREGPDQSPKAMRILESRRQGRIDEVEFLLRTSWTGWNPQVPDEHESGAADEDEREPTVFDELMQGRDGHILSLYVRRYIEWVNESEEARAELVAFCDNMLESTRDPDRRHSFQELRHDALTGEGPRDSFVLFAKEWSDAVELTVDELLTVGVEPEVLERAGFDLPPHRPS